MTPCPTPEQLRRLLEETLPAAEQPALHAHLDACPACQQALDRLAAGGATWDRAAAHLGPEPEPTDAVLDKVVRELQSAPPTGASGPAHTPPGGETQAEAAPDPLREELSFLAPPAQPGHLGRLGHYEVIEVVGRGGMGVVLKAIDERLQRVVAIKVLGPQYAGSGSARKRFQREAKAAAAVSHDHVVPIYHVDEINGVSFLVMPLIVGQSLQERIDQDGPLELPEILRIGLQTAEGLAAAHKMGLVHRDIKPANILLENGVERVKITDFGLARAVDDASVTQSGVITGTPMFMSPEQARGEYVIDYRSDLFSLGSVLYLMCTGRPPFRASSTHATLRRVIEDTPRPLHEINPEVPDWLEAIIGRLHAKDPADRFQSAREVAELLGQHLAHLQDPRRVPRPSRVLAPAATGLPAAAHSQAWVLWLVLLLVLLLAVPVGLLLVGGVGALYLLSGSSQPQPGWPVQEVAPAPPPPPVAPPVVEPPFVLFAPGVPQHVNCDSVAQAVGLAREGWVIEVRGNGPYQTPALTVDKKLTIRAGAGFHPILRLAAADAAAGKPLLTATAPLVLEGLELQAVNVPAWKDDSTPNQNLLHVARAPFHAANCRFVINRLGQEQFALTCVSIAKAPACELRNCVLLQKEGDFLSAGEMPAGSVVGVENCLIKGYYGLALGTGPNAGVVHVRLTDNTIVSYATVMIHVKNPAVVSPAYELEIDGNLLAGGYRVNDLTKEGVPVADLEKLARGLVRAREGKNLYAFEKSPLFALLRNHRPLAGATPITAAADWGTFWGDRKVDALQAPAQFKGYNHLARMEYLTPDSFRLKADSPGKGAGAGGRDLGADIDLVGPGPAYERWRQTPAYQQWLRTSGQATAPK